MVRTGATGVRGATGAAGPAGATGRQDREGPAVPTGANGASARDRLPPERRRRRRDTAARWKHHAAQGLPGAPVPAARRTGAPVGTGDQRNKRPRGSPRSRGARGAAGHAGLPAQLVIHRDRQGHAQASCPAPTRMRISGTRQPEPRSGNACYPRDGDEPREERQAPQAGERAIAPEGRTSQPHM